MRGLSIFLGSQDVVAGVALIVGRSRFKSLPSHEAFWETLDLFLTLHLNLPPRVVVMIAREEEIKLCKLPWVFALAWER